MKSEIGSVIQAIKGEKPYYQVRLAHGEVVVVMQSQITPARLTMLQPGVRLRVTHELGVVQSASTDLALELSGQVTGLAGSAYLVEPENGPVLTVQRSQVQHHPQHALGVGAELRLRLENDQIQQVSLVAETLRAQVQAVDLAKSAVHLKDEHGESWTVRLPLDLLRELKAGMVLPIQVRYSPQGERQIGLERPVSWKREEENPKAPAPRAERGVPRKPQPRPAKPETLAVGEVLGIDLHYLEERKRENHRAEVMEFLERHKRDGAVEWYRMRENRPARLSAPQQPLDGRIQAAIADSSPGFKGLYQHQARALDAIRQERNLVMVTQTASGKTLGYNPAVFEHLCTHSQAHALYIFPLNALMMDQKEKIDDLRARLEKQRISISAELLRGGLGSERAEIARRSPNILATNPEMLSVVLAEAKNWGAFFRGLKYVVIDEVHSYRGIFGVQMAGLLRRLLLTARRFGADPRFILCSATVSNPLDLASRLTSLPEDSFTLLDEREDGSQQACKHWAVMNPDWGSTNNRHDNYLNVAAAAFVELISGRGGLKPLRPLNTILFCRSIREVNHVSKLIKKNLETRRPDLVSKIRSYVAANLSVEQKRQIYQGLRSGSLVGVISTNALEAGIDIGHLDACIIAGFPFSVMGMRQMAGRVGRHEEGLVLFVPSPFNSLDQYYRDHPDLLLSQPPELFVVDPENMYISRKHINAAALALNGLTESELDAFWGQSARQVAMQAQSDGAMHLVNGRWLGTRRDYNNPDDMYALHSIRSNSQRPYAVCLDDGHPCSMQPACFDPTRKPCERQVVVLDREYVYRDCHPGAVYEAPDGRLYRVTRFDDAARVVRVHELPEDTLERTSAEEEIHLETQAEPRAHRELLAGVELAWGDVTVTRRFTGYSTYQLIPRRRCRSCRKEYDAAVSLCPACQRTTELYFTNSRATPCTFPQDYQEGFKIALKTVACRLSVHPEVKTRLQDASPCKLPGSTNRVLRWLRSPLNLSSLPARLGLADAEQAILRDYHQRGVEALEAHRNIENEALVFPGIYGQCLLSSLRQRLPESRALELFQAVTAYPVTDHLNHICRACQGNCLNTALHTLEHTVLSRYPSVALGDRSDLGAFTNTEKVPAIYWFDDYEGGLGAAEKIFQAFRRLLEASAATLQDCACTTLEGCPRCTFVGGRSSENDGLNKRAALELIHLINAQEKPRAAFTTLIYPGKRQAELDRLSEKNEFASHPLGLGEEAIQMGQVR